MYLDCLKKIESKLLDNTYVIEIYSHKNTLHVDYLEMEKFSSFQNIDINFCIQRILSQILNLSKDIKKFKEYNIFALIFLVLNKRHNNIPFEKSLGFLSINNLSVYVLDDFLESKEASHIKSLIPNAMLFLGLEEDRKDYNDFSNKSLLMIDYLNKKHLWLKEISIVFGKSNVLKYIKESLEEDKAKGRWIPALMKELFLYEENTTHVLENNLRESLKFWGSKTVKGNPVLFEKFVLDGFLNTVLFNLLNQKYNNSCIDLPQTILKSISISDKQFLMFLSKEKEKFIIDSGSNIEYLFRNHPLFLNKKIRKNMEILSDSDLSIDYSNDDYNFKL